MINKLRKKIQLLVIFVITFPLLVIITFYTFSYYNNIIKTNANFIDRFFKEPNGGPKRTISDVDGVYSITVKDNNVTSSDNITEEIKEYALSINGKTNEIGIIGKYIYKKRVNEDETNIVLIESSKEINNIKIVIISSVLSSSFGILLTYYLSKKIAYIIIKPVEDTFNKQKDFISDASHELKTPLAVIEANTDVLEGEIGKNKWLAYIQNETDNMSKLINELLLLTKIENIDKIREPERFNMSSHIALIISSFESMAFESSIKIKSNIQEGIITETFNKEDITHILSTLIDNAIKHSKKDVIIELQKNKDKIILSVKNKGEEIPISEREKIFDRFYRIDKARNRNEKRYGLGLAIAKSTVLKNNGTIKVDYQNGYTIFKVELPI